MKPDGDTMEPTEPTEDAAVAEPSSLQDNTTEEAPSQPEEAAIDVAPETIPKGNGKPVAADSKVKPKCVSTKTQPAAKSAGPSGSRPGTSSHRTVNDVKSSANVSAAAAKKTATTTKAASAAGGGPKRPVGAAASSTIKTLSRTPDKKPVGPARTTSAAASTATNVTKPTTVNGVPKKRPVAETAARPKTTAPASRAAAFTASKPSTSTTSKAVGATTKPVASVVSKTTRPTTAPSTSRPASTTSRPTTAALKLPTTAAARTAASRVNTAPPTGRTTAAQPPRTVAAKKDVSRPTSVTVANKLLAATTAADAKKNPRPTAPVKLNTASKCPTTTKAADPKVSQTKVPAKSTPTKKPVASVLSLAQNKQPFGRSPPASPANRPANSSTPQAKRRTKPTQAVLPFTATKNTGVSSILKAAAGAQRAAGGAGAAVETPPVLAQSTTLDVVPQETAVRQEAASSPPRTPSSTLLPQTPTPLMETESSALLPTTQEQTPAPAEPALPPVACPPDYTEEPGYQTPSTSKALPAAANSLSLKVPPTNLNEEEDEEGSQLVSVSEMSGTTQPTEESRPGSAGPVGGSAWKAGGALFSELDSEEVSGSQQGASELSAPGVLEGTESMDDLGDGSLKGAIDMEGASAGSPDFEKVPDIPANDFDEDDDFDDDRVCDMDVGSERADEPQRLRHDNDANDEEEEEDEDVEMASEGVTESGLESYGNADEDDFAEDERLDNLNRVAEPPPPLQLPSAPAAQWEQPNPFVDPWHADPEHQQLLVAVSQPEQEAGVAATSPSADPWHADSETPTQASAWLELGSAPLVPENQEAPHQSSVKDEPQDLAPMQTLALVLLSAPPMSLSSTLSSETSTPEELCDYNRDGKAQDVHAPALSPQPELDHEEAETLPADEVLGGPATSPTNNPSSTSVTEDEANNTEGEAQLDDSLETTLPADEVLGGPATSPSSPSVTEDEASDTEGEAQLDDSLETTMVSQHITFDSQSLSQCCLSTVEEGEEADTEEARAGEDTTPPSATSLASYGFDTMTTASNAQSTGESCVRSPGIFSLEELPEEAKELCLIPQPHTPPCFAEHQYIDCGKQESDSAEPAENTSRGVPGPEEAPDPSSAQSTLQQAEENPEDVQPPYYSAICEKTENSFAGFAALPQPHRRDHSAYPRTYCDLVKPLVAAPPPKLTCADLPPRNMGQKALSPQLRRLEQHQRQLLEMQLRRDQQSRPLEEAEQERKTREEEEARKKKDEAEEEIKRNKEELERKTQELAKKEEEEEEKRRRELELQQHQELKERQQIMQWQQELQQANKEQAELLLASSVLCTIYEALENSDGEEELNPTKEETPNGDLIDDERGDSPPSTESPPPLRDSPQTSTDPSQDGDSSSPCPPESPERPPPLELDWGKKVDIVQQLINQTLLLNRGGCSSLLLLPRGAGGTLSPLESSLWPSLLPPLTPPSATVTSVSSFSPEATGSSPQGEWTVVELETHH
ncbi:proline-rich protein 36 [Pseudochaenichthys georgianus]|uniref:proline-rich protein 36 n=1 Tax=Pseudochaenichthys georgianus TaxID=52239 RepID=UPI00146D72BE|nr:flocculation protein FLO11 [Pseudochaenichthys georgianus]